MLKNILYFYGHVLKIVFWFTVINFVKMSSNIFYSLQKFTAFRVNCRLKVVYEFKDRGVDLHRSTYISLLMVYFIFHIHFTHLISQFIFHPRLQTVSEFWPSLFMIIWVLLLYLNIIAGQPNWKPSFGATHKFDSALLSAEAWYKVRYIK